MHKPQDTMRPAELERSRGSARNGTAVVRSCDEQDVPSAFQAQYAAVKRAYASARVVCLASAGNGDRPVFALVNRDFDPSQPFNVQTHYHGIGSSVQQGPHSARVKELLSNAPPAAQTLVVLPESGDMSTVERWNNVTSQAQTTQDAEEAVRRALGSPTTWNVAQRVVSLHSAGGDVLRLSATKRPPSLRADRIELLDCLYDNGALTRAGCPKVTDALTAIAKAYPDATFVYRRFENSEKELAADGAMKLRGEIVQDRVGSDRFAIVDRAAPGGPRSHEDAARFLGVQ